VVVVVRERKREGRKMHKVLSLNRSHVATQSRKGWPLELVQITFILLSFVSPTSSQLLEHGRTCARLRGEFDAKRTIMGLGRKASVNTCLENEANRADCTINMIQYISYLKKSNVFEE
jgi:hypothetical protein